MTLKNSSTSKDNAVISAGVKCDAGKKNNEDSAYLKLLDIGQDRLIVTAVVADGVGGLDKGEFASLFITKSVKKWLEENAENIRSMSFQELTEDMERLTLNIHEELVAISEERNSKFGSTMTFAIIGKTKYNIVQVGDSRAYIYDGRWVSLITKDQTVAEHEKVTGTKITRIPEDRKQHTLMQCMGVGQIQPQSYTGVLPKNFDILLCSDGLSNTLLPSNIKSELKKDISCSDVLNNLITTARHRGEDDNISGILIRKRSQTKKTK